MVALDVISFIGLTIAGYLGVFRNDTALAVVIGVVAGPGYFLVHGLSKRRHARSNDDGTIANGPDGGVNTPS
ncbi:MAG: hypothetical protein JWR35_3916 [Marmoricola sp.]|nr:hypothetical protein [Marmoricola sp.]